MPDETKAMIEAALFISPRPLDIGELARVCNLGNPGSIRHAVEELQKEYAGRNSAVEISVCAVAQRVSRIHNVNSRIVKEKEGYIMRLRADMEERLTYLAPQQDIPKPHLKTLALIAYNQPVKQSQMVVKRGAVVYEHVRHLVASGFVEAKKEGSTKILRTTPMFKEYFKLRNLKDLKNK